MLDHHAIPQVTRELRAQREGEAKAHRLVLEARGSRESRVWRRQLARELERLLALVVAPTRRAGTSC
jgi:regulator of protease activity HflC (stomatin/prohibitin superfamily)